MKRARRPDKRALDAPVPELVRVGDQVVELGRVVVVERVRAEHELVREVAHRDRAAHRERHLELEHSEKEIASLTAQK